MGRLALPVTYRAAKVRTFSQAQKLDKVSWARHVRKDQGTPRGARLRRAVSGLSDLQGPMSDQFKYALTVIMNTKTSGL